MMRGLGPRRPGSNPGSPIREGQSPGGLSVTGFEPRFMSEIRNNDYDCANFRATCEVRFASNPGSPIGFGGSKGAGS